MSLVPTLVSHLFFKQAKANNWESACICCQDVPSSPPPESLCSSIFVSAEMCSRRGSNTLILQSVTHIETSGDVFRIPHLIPGFVSTFYIYLETDSFRWFSRYSDITKYLFYAGKNNVLCCCDGGASLAASMKRWRAHSSPLTK